MIAPFESQIAVIVLAAGNGTRLGRGEPKAFVDLDGRPSLVHALEPVLAMRELSQVIITVPTPFIPVTRQLVRGMSGFSEREVTVVAGGESRQASVALALESLLPTVDIVLVHDAARALTPSVVFDSVAAEVRRGGLGVIPGLPVNDTIKRVDETGSGVETLDRSELSVIQTPQGFPREHLVRAHRVASSNYTDDAGLVSSAGYDVSIIAGDPLAFKITTAWDLRRAEQLLSGNSASESIRIGMGTDAHAFAESAPLWLAGLYWPGEVGLSGHSDGDVVCHAICDAMLSAAKLGDIGTAFGTKDPRFSDVHGDVFLRETLMMVREAGLEIGNISVQVIGNHPLFAPRRTEAERLLSGIIGATVSISATTTDSLGFAGRGEGIIAIATALAHAQTAAPRPDGHATFTG